MFFAFGIFSFVVEIDDFLFPLFNIFPIFYVLDIKYHVSSKLELSWRALESGVKGGPNRKGCCT